MNVPLRRTDPDAEEMGDVLTSIRRLIARDDAPRRATLVHHRDDAGAPGAVARPLAGPRRAAALEIAQSGAGDHGQGEPVGSSQVSPAAALGMADQLRSVAGSVPPAAALVIRGDPEPPLRLSPDAMIRAADAANPGGRLQLPPGLAVVERTTAALSCNRLIKAKGQRMPALAEPPAPPPQSGRDDATGGAADSPDAAGEAEMAAAILPPCAERLEPLSQTEPSIKEVTMQAYANGVESPRYADPQMAGVAPHALAGAANTAPREEENPLRALLRQVVREQFEAEMQRRLDMELRRMIRDEITTALTEALIRRPA